MPTYEFLCESCGPFERWRDHRQSSVPMPCPVCEAAARRVYSAPGLNVTSKAGTEEPRLVERPQAQEPTPSRRPQGVGGRPWQISH